MQINTNMNAIYASNALSNVSNEISKSVQRISTGQKISTDDPASIFAGTRTKAQILGVVKMNEALNTAIGLAQAQDTALSEVQTMLSSMYDAAMSVNNNLAGTDEWAAANEAFGQLGTNIVLLEKQVTYGKDIPLFEGTDGYELYLNEDQDPLKLEQYDIATGLTSEAMTITSQTSAEAAAAAVLTDMGTIAKYQAEVGATMNSLRSASNVNDAVIGGLTSAYSNITNVDLAAETSKLAAAQIRQNAAAAMFAQSNSMDREVVSYLLKGL